MDFYDVVCAKVSKTADRTIKGAGKISTIAKLKFNLMKEKAALEESYKELGEIYYKQLKNIDYDDGKISLAYDKIEQSICEIERISQEIDKVNGNYDGADKKTDPNVVYCPKCGKKQIVKKD